MLNSSCAALKSIKLGSPHEGIQSRSRPCGYDICIPYRCDGSRADQHERRHIYDIVHYDSTRRLVHYSPTKSTEINPTRRHITSSRRPTFRWVKVVESCNISCQLQFTV